MANMKEIKGHIKRINDTRKITKAMYLISSAKFRNTKAQFLKFIPFFAQLEKQKNRIFSALSSLDSPYFHRQSGKTALLVVTSDKGFAGEYNKNIIKAAKEQAEKSGGCDIFVIGEKGKTAFAGYPGYRADFDYTMKAPDYGLSKEIAGYFTALFESGEYGEIRLIYTGITDGTHPEVKNEVFLPLAPDEDYGPGEEYEFFPDTQTVAREILPLYIEGYMHSVLIQCCYSEHSLRMTAMDSAEKNAKKMVDELTLQYNHLRQNSITQEITEIAGERKVK